MNTYRFQKVTGESADLSRMAELLDSTFQSHGFYCARHLQWQYVENPDGLAVGVNAVKEGQLAAHYVVQPLQATIQGKRLRGALSFNTATHPAHQGKGLFTQLANQTYELCREAGISFVVGVANANSTPGFLKKLGFQLVAPLDARLVLGNPRFKQDHNPLSFAREWSDSALAWRLKNPSKSYFSRRCGEYFSPEVFTGTAKILATMSFKKSLGVSLPSAPLIHNPFRLWLGMDPELDWKGCVTVPIPMRLRPSPLNLIFKDLSGQGLSLDASRVRFHSLDFDAY